MPGEAIQIGPFIGGLNTYSDPTAIADNELVQCENFEIDLDGSLKSRPPFVDEGVTFPLGVTGNYFPLGYYYDQNSTPFLIASDGLSSTYYFNGTTWVLITNTFAASAMTQFDNKAWLVSPLAEASPGGYWTPGGGFVAEANMPHGEVIVGHKFRLWVAPGQEATTNGTRLYRSNVLGTVPFWPVAPDFIDVGSGDGQNIVAVAVHYNNLLIFRTESIYGFQFTSDPANGITSLIVPGVGLSAKEAFVQFESYIYFMYADRAYEFSNSRASLINPKTPFRATTEAGGYMPFAVSEFNRRVIFSYFDTMYVFGLKTRTWTTWKTAVWGSIGKIVPLHTNTEIETAIAHSSRLALPAAIDRTNNYTDPDCTTTVGKTAVNGAVLSIAGGKLRSVCPANGIADSGVGLGVPAVVAGQTVTYSFNLTATEADTYRISIEGVTGLASDSQSFSAGATGRMSITFTHTAPGTPTVNVYRSNGAAIRTFDIDNILVETAPADQGSFSGATVDSTRYQYDWVGAANASASTRTRLRTSITLFLTDALTSGAEPFECIAQTKNFNYEASSVYKRLFWWGIDATFRGEVTGLAVPIVYNYTVTWGQLLNTTWGQLLAHTWGQPSAGGLSVETIRSTAGTTTTRKFVKFMKSLRFRQIYFRVTFETDGSSSTAPVRLFSLMTYVRPKERVSKTIT